jgi:hypothetical protein
MGYYKVIDGLTVDGDLIALAERANHADQEGWISLVTARKLFDLVIDGGVYSEVERATVAYILDHMRWRPDAKQWFVSELHSWEVMKSRPVHREIEGKIVDHELYGIAEQAVKTNRDGLINEADAKALYEAVVDGGIYTSVEWETMRLIRKNMRWRPEAMAWFERELAAWEAAQQKSIPMSLGQISKEQFSKEDVFVEEYDRFSREVDLRAATMEAFDQHDEIGLIVRLQDGRRVEVTSSIFTLHDHFVELRGGVTIPIRAIEKVEI